MGVCGHDSKPLPPSPLVLLLYNSSHFDKLCMLAIVLQSLCMYSCVTCLTYSTFRSILHALYNYAVHVHRALVELSRDLWTAVIKFSLDKDEEQFQEVLALK